MRIKTRVSLLLTPLLFALFLAATLPFGARADVVDYFANADANRRLEFGDGRDGAFVNGPTQAGITVAGATITIDTSVKSIFQFTSFTLSAGFTLNASGTEPLVIRVQGPATVAGTLHLDGAAGGPALAAAPGAGGAAGAGGGNGGLGGKQPASPVDGANASPRTGVSIGGGGGPNDPAISGQREGGGGCMGPGATGGALYPASAATCPYSFVDAADRFESSFFLPAAGSVPGGGGGGGGGTRNLNALNNMNGAGGGGAGGALVLTASGDVAISGTITASGGAGGAGQLGASDYGASGGGGSGGALWIQSASRVSGAGALTVAPGTGGQDAFAASVGGTGSRGVVRIDATTPAFTGTVSPSGSIDRTYNVFPVTVEFGISAGPACGSVSHPGHELEDLRNFFLNALVWCALFALVNFALSGRSANSSRSGSKS